MMLLLGIGIFEGGRAYHASLTVSHAARDGARVASDPANSVATIQAAVAASASPLTPSSITVARTGSTATVTVAYEFESPLFGVMRLWDADPMTIERTLSARVDTGA